MFRVTLLWTWARTLVNALLGCLTTRPAGALLATPKIRLYRSGGPVTPDATVADFTAVTATGIADTAITLTGAVNAAGDIQAYVGHVDFISTGTGTYVPDTAEGYILFDGTSAFYGGEQFSAPVNFGDNGDYLGLDVVVPINTSEGSGQS